MNSGSNGADLRETVFNTINLLTEIESGNNEATVSQPEPIANVNNYNAPQASYTNMINNAGMQHEEAALSDRFISGIQNKMLDPNKLERIRNGTASEYDTLKYKMEQEMNTLRNVIEKQSSQLSEMKNMVDLLKSEISSIRAVASQVSQTAAQVAPQAQPMMQSQQMQPQYQQQMQQSPQMAPQKQSAPIISAVTGKVMDAGPKEANPRVGGYESADVSIEKYFYCGK